MTKVASMGGGGGSCLKWNMMDYLFSHNNYVFHIPVSMSCPDLWDSVLRKLFWTLNDANTDHHPDNCLYGAHRRSTGRCRQSKHLSPQAMLGSRLQRGMPTLLKLFQLQLIDPLSRVDLVLTLCRESVWGQKMLHSFSFFSPNHFECLCWKSPLVINHATNCIAYQTNTNLIMIWDLLQEAHTPRLLKTRTWTIHPLQISAGSLSWNFITQSEDHFFSVLQNSILLPSNVAYN